MTRSLLHSLLFIVCLSVVVTNCSTPLEPGSVGEPAPPIIITITDTVVDTLIQNGTDTLIDTLIQSEVDTIVIIDTLIDTVFVDVTDTTEQETHCGILERCKKKLVWQLTNTPGKYRLEITIQKYDKRYPKDLIVRIDGEKYPWHPDKVDTMSVEQHLSEQATISIERADWCGWYHAAKFCVTLIRLE